MGELALPVSHPIENIMDNITALIYEEGSPLPLFSASLGFVLDDPQMVFCPF